MFCTRRSTNKRTLHILPWTSAVQYDFKEHGVYLEVEGVCYNNYRDASRAAYVLGPPPSRGGDLELEGGVNVSL